MEICAFPFRTHLSLLDGYKAESAIDTTICLSEKSLHNTKTAVEKEENNG